MNERLNEPIGGDEPLPAAPHKVPDADELPPAPKRPGGEDDLIPPSRRNTGDDGEPLAASPVKNGAGEDFAPNAAAARVLVARHDAEDAARKAVHPNVTASAPMPAPQPPAAGNQPGGRMEKRSASRPVPGKDLQGVAGRRAAKAVLLFALAAVLLTVGAFAAAVAFHKPTPDSEIHFTAPPEQVPDDPLGDAPDVERGVLSFTRKKDVFNFLLVGLDAKGENHTDVILLLSYDAADGSASMLSIPRDTYINVGRNFSKLNSYYTGEYNRFTSKEGLRGEEARTAAMESLTALLETNLAVQIDWWAQIDLEAFRNIVDLFGGVELDIAADMDYEDPYQDLYIHLKAGRQTLNGEQAEQFVRFRDGYATADIGRINAQKIFIAAFLQTVRKNLSVSTIGGVAEQMKDHMLTSLSAMDCVYFAKSALKTLDPSDVYMVTLPAEGTTNRYTGAWYEVMYRADALELLNARFNVYEERVTDRLFDPSGVFTNTEAGWEYIDELYRTPAGTASGGSSAEEISENAVDTQLGTFKPEYLEGLG